LFALTAGCAGAAAPPAPAAERSLTIDHVINIKHPSEATWAPDGRRLAFVWEQAGVQNVWLADTEATGTAAPKSLTSYESGSVENLFWSKDGRTLYFVRDGDLWQVTPGEGQARAVWTTKEVEGPIVLAPDGARVAFVRGGQPGVPFWQRTEGDLFVRSMADGREVRLTQGQGLVSGPRWSPDGTRLAFTVGRVNLVSESPDYSGSKISYSRVDHQVTRPAVVAATGGKVTLMAPSPGMDPAISWLDGSRLLVQRLSGDNKTRELAIEDLKTGQSRALYHETGAKFWSLPYVASDPLPSPDGKWVAIVSDRDGWDNLYVIPAAGGDPVQLTKGRVEVRHATWSSDSTRIFYSVSQIEQPGVRHLAAVTIGSDPAKAQIAMLTSGRGTNILPVPAANAQRVVYQHTDPQNSADLYLVNAAAGDKASPVRLTDSMPSGIDRNAFVEPQLVRYAAPDGQQVPAYLFVPKGLDKTRKHPAILWIHGDGVNQNYDGWHVERNYATYYAFHQYLNQLGYVVLAPDYRGSIGYGRDWRQGVYLDVGGKDAKDASAGAAYLKTLDYVDSERIGVWGLSYGGYFTLIAMADNPTTFRCGIDVAGVVDFGMWYQDPGGEWVVGRMQTPADNPKLYQESAVINRIDKISRPLMILAGTADVNVPYLESVRLVDAMLKNGQDIEFMMYPREFHYFTRAHVLRDAWKRTQRFFDQHLQPGSAKGTD
jgi:dipeptidyl aminopeptidase/acylaminoacyl peptidase